MQYFVLVEYLHGAKTRAPGKVPCILLIPEKVHYIIKNSLPYVSILSHTKVFYTLLLYLLNIQFNIILLPVSKYSKCSVLSNLPLHTRTYVSLRY